MAPSNTLFSPAQDPRNFNQLFSNDQAFDQLYPNYIQKKALKHWSPIEVAKYAAEFLAAQKNVHILDIGCGIGKFCLTAAYTKPHAMIYGIEQREQLVQLAMQCNEQLNLPNVNFIHGNFTQLDFRQFDHFYFYNSFYENLDGVDKIDNELEYSLSLYNYYNRYLFKELEQKPKGTRIVTFHSLEGEIPPSYYTVNSAFDNSLKCWIKV